MYELKIRLPNGTRINLTAVKGSLPEVARFIKELPMSEPIPSIGKVVKGEKAKFKTAFAEDLSEAPPSPPSPPEKEKEELAPKKVKGRYEF